MYSLQLSSISFIILSTTFQDETEEEEKDKNPEDKKDNNDDKKKDEKTLKKIKGISGSSEQRK